VESKGFTAFEKAGRWPNWVGHLKEKKGEKNAENENEGLTQQECFRWKGCISNPGNLGRSHSKQLKGQGNVVRKIFSLEAGERKIPNYFNQEFF